jgi:hypothetical protein
MITRSTRGRIAALTPEDTAIAQRAGERVRWSSLVAMIRGDRSDDAQMHSLVDAGARITISHAPSCPVSDPDFICDVDPRAPQRCNCDFMLRLKNHLGM